MRIATVGVGRAIVRASLEAGTYRAPTATSAGAFARHLRPVPPHPLATASTRAAPLPVPTTPRSTSAFEQRVAAMAARLRMQPRDLMAVMRFESGLRPDAINPTSHAVGLIQFMPRTAADLLGLPASMPDRNAVAVRSFAAMSADEQLDYVEAYLDRVLGGRGARDLRDAYMAVLYPAAVGKGDSYVIARADSESAVGRAVFRQNAALDVDGDGTITAGEAARRVAGVRG